MNDELSYYKESNMELVFYRQVDKSYPMHTHFTHFVLGFVLEGSISIQNNEKDYICQKGEYFLVYPNVAHSFVSNNHTAYSMISLCIEAEYMLTAEFADILSTVRDLLSRVLEEHPEIASHQDEIEDALQVFYAGLTGMVYPVSGFTEELKEKLLSGPEEHISINEMSESICISPYHMIREFKKEMGLTPHQFQLQSRIRKAQRLLESGETVIKVAYATGFCDQSHFDRCFKKSIGLAPSEYVEAVHTNDLA